MSTIYGVYADDYESSPLIKAFLSKRAAEAFKQRCEEHEGKRPEGFFGPSDPLNWTAEEDAAFDAWDAKHRRWAKRHPAKGFDYYKSFSLGKITLVEE